MQAKLSPRSPPKSWSVSYPHSRSPVVSSRKSAATSTGTGDYAGSSGIGSMQIGSLTPTRTLFRSSTIPSSTIIARRTTSSSAHQQPSSLPQLPDFNKADIPQFLHKQTILKDGSLLRDPHTHISGGPSIVCHASNFHSQVNEQVKACPFCRRYLLNRTAALVSATSDGANVTEGDVLGEKGENKGNTSSAVAPPSNVKTQTLRGNSKSKDRRRTLSDFEGVVSNLTFSKVLVEGWLLKKGSGNDWLGDTKYKPRWARLVLANIPGQEVDVPVLNVYWFETSVTPSSTLFLDQAIAKPVDRDAEEWKNVHCFDIIMESPPQDISDQQDERQNMKRRFAASADERNEWIYAINVALAEFKRSKSQTEGDGCVEPKPAPEFTPSTRWKEGEFSGG